MKQDGRSYLKKFGYMRENLGISKYSLKFMSSNNLVLQEIRRKDYQTKE